MIDTTSNAMMDKAVILARGLGTRMRASDDAAEMTAKQAAVAKTGVKAMIPIDRPFLDYVLHDLSQAGYKRVCLVIGPEHGAVRDYYSKEVTCQHITIEFAIQEKPLGTADAVAAAEEFANDDPFLIINSDNYYPLEALRSLRELKGSGLAAFDRDAMLAQSNIPSERITKFAIIESNGSGHMSRIIEKPDAATLASLSGSICLSMNCWRFGPSIFPACRAIKPSPRGELELPDAVQYAIDQLNDTFSVLNIKAPVLDLSSRSDIASVAQRLRGKKLSF